MNTIISKDMFEKQMSAIVKLWEFQDSLFQLSNEFNAVTKEETHFWFPTLMDNLVEVLSAAMHDTDEWIQYWVYELNCGKNYKEGTVT